MANILITGNATLDIINHVAHYPHEDEEIRALQQNICRGGNASNTATVLRQFSHDCQIACTLANDAGGKWILQDFVDLDIKFDQSFVISKGSTPTSYITLNQANGSRTIVHHRDLTELSSQKFDLIDLQDFHWFHFEARNIEQLEQMMLKTRGLDSPVSLEVEKNRPDIDRVLPLADVIMFSRDFAQSSGYQTMEHCLQHFATVFPDKTLTCTWGDQGAHAFYKNCFYTSPAYPPENLVDTIGAGDTFNAGLIHAILNNNSIQSALQFACELAGNKCGQYGFKNLVRSN